MNVNPEQDRPARLGSSNFNNRVTEYDLAVEPRGEPRLERAIPALLHQCSADHLAMSPRTVAETMSAESTVAGT
jgi:hypothetical protein